MTTLNDFTYTDGIDDVLAEYVNALLAATLRSEYRNVETISADRQLLDLDTPFQLLTASGANRNVKLAAEATTNHVTVISNAGASNNLVIKDDSAATTFVTLLPGEWCMAVSNGSSWTILEGRATLKTYFDTLYLPIGGGSATDGWTSGTGTWSYSSADSPTFVISINADVTAILSAGMRIKLTQTTVKYFIVTAVGAYSGGATLVTVYGGTDYTLANAAISSPYYSIAKAPFGFPLSPAKWTVEVTDTTQRSQGSPSAGTWYNLGSVSISVPIGIWRVTAKVTMQASISGTVIDVHTTLSTANNSESDVDFTTSAQNNSPTGSIGVVNSVNVEKVLTLAAKTSYYLNTKSTVSATNIYNRNDIAKCILRAVCAYL